MKVELRIPSGTLFQTPKTDFEHAHVWTTSFPPRILAYKFLYGFPIDKRRQTDIHIYNISHEISIEQPSEGARFARPIIHTSTELNAS